MVQIQINATEDLSKQLGIYKIKNNLASKAEAVVKICSEKLAAKE